MATANDLYQDAVIRRALQIEGLGRESADKVARMLASVEADVEDAIRRYMARVGDAGGSERLRKVAQLRAMLEVIRDIRQRVISRAFEQLDLVSVMEDAAAASAEDLRRALGIELTIALPSARALGAIVETRPMLGRLISKWFEDLAEADIVRIDSAIQTGIVEGLTTDEIVRRVRGTRALDFKDGIIRITGQHAESLVLTATKYVTEAAREAMWAANADIIMALRWSSVLDGRTTPICRARDGKYRANGSKEDWPSSWVEVDPPNATIPAHWRCRSVYVAVLSPEGVIGDKPFVVDTRTRDRREVDFRKQARAEAGGGWSSMSRADRNAAMREQRRRWAEERVGRVPAETTYAQFLGRQSARFQDEVLGPARGSLFRRGGLSLDDLVTPSGYQIPLAELRKRHPEAFRRAGL